VRSSRGRAGPSRSHAGSASFDGKGPDGLYRRCSPRPPDGAAWARSILEGKDTHELAEKDPVRPWVHKEKRVSDGMVECEWCGILVFDEDDDFYRGS
jgi:hypothetical protein